MGTEDVAVKKWLQDKKRFADFFNGTVFGGEQRIRPEELETMESESELLISDKNGKKKALKRYRDIVMRWKGETELAVLACENQGRVHYAMPLRNMLYDCLAYTDQVELLWDKERGKVTGEEYLSHFRKEDGITPVITLVFYYGEREWNGSLDLYGMFPASFWQTEKILKRYVPNYRINLIDAAKLETVNQFKSDLQEVFGMLKYRKKKKELVEYIQQNREFFEAVEPRTYEAICALLQSETQLKKYVVGKAKEAVNICQALKELYEDGVKCGEAQGRAEGRAEGAEQGEILFASLTEKLLQAARMEDLLRATTDKEFRKKLYVEYGLR